MTRKSAQQIAIDVSRSDSNHIHRAVEALARAGWRASMIPAQGRLRSNQQLVDFRAQTTGVKVRLSIFAVGDRGESHRRDERRIQITTTYLGGLKRPLGYKDVVLGYDSENDVYVGLDPRRLNFGGEKHNASSWVDSNALTLAGNGIIIRPHETQIIGLEYQAIFPPRYLAEYIFSADSIHQDRYVGLGGFSGPANGTSYLDALTVPSENASGELLILEMSSVPQAKPKVKKSLITAYENQDIKALADVSPEQLRMIRQRCAEIGDKGEYYAYRYEKQRLRKAGKDELATKVDWVSRRAVGRGYDIKSYEVDGSPRFIEVKATNGFGMTFFMSDYEWKVAEREQDAYYIYRVVDVDRTPTLKRVVRNPLTMEKARKLARVPAGWKLTLR